MALGVSIPHVLSPSLCHLADPEVLIQVRAIPPLPSSASPFSLASCLSVPGAGSPLGFPQVVSHGWSPSGVLSLASQSLTPLSFY